MLSPDIRSPILYAITDRQMFSGDEAERSGAVVAQAIRLAGEGVDLLQVRERDLPVFDLETLTRRILQAVAAHPRPKLRVLLNGPAQLAVETRAHGVHLRGGSGARELAEVRHLFGRANLSAPVVSVSCHTVAEVRSAALAGFDYILFGPVFEKRVRDEAIHPGLGLAQLQEAATLARPAHLLALGGVTRENAPLCLEAGASGIAAIRLFLDSPESYPEQ